MWQYNSHSDNLAFTWWVFVYILWGQFVHIDNLKAHLLSSTTVDLIQNPVSQISHVNADACAKFWKLCQ